MSESLGVYLLSVFISTVSQVLLKVSANKPWPNRLREYANEFVIGAYAFFLLSLFLSSQALRNMSASFAPVIDSSSYIFVLIMGYFLFHEKITAKRMIGIALIILGGILFGL